MVDPHYFIYGVLAGLIFSVPVGPVATLVIRQAAERRATSAVITGVGATVSDCVFSLLAICLSRLLPQLIQTYRFELYLAAGVFVAIVAYATWRKPISLAPANPKTGPWVPRPLLQGFLLASFNPANIIGISATIYGLAGVVPPSQVAIFIAGVMAGGTAWWLVLSAVVARIRRHLEADVLRRLSLGLAAVLCVASAGLFLQALLAFGAR